MFLLIRSEILSRAEFRKVITVKPICAESKCTNTQPHKMEFKRALTTCPTWGYNFGKISDNYVASIAFATKMFTHSSKSKTLKFGKDLSLICMYEMHATGNWKKNYACTNCWA